MHTSLFRITEDGLLVVNGKVDVFMVSGEPELLKKADDFYCRKDIRVPTVSLSGRDPAISWCKRFPRRSAGMTHYALVIAVLAVNTQI